MTNKDIIIIYIKEFSFDPKNFLEFEKHIKQINEDDSTKVILVPSPQTEKVERL